MSNAHTVLKSSLHSKVHADPCDFHPSCLCPVLSLSVNDRLHSLVVDAFIFQNTKASVCLCLPTWVLPLLAVAVRKVPSVPHFIILLVMPFIE
jgi:hypothetical protein